MQCQSRISNLFLVPFASSHQVARPTRRSILPVARGVVQSIWAVLLLLVLIVASATVARAQQAAAPSSTALELQSADQQEPALPFDVSNPRHKKWPEAEAARIYNWACDLLARAIRPEKPPQLHPRFRLVLGASEDEFVRDSAASEIHLKSWNPDKFAQGVVVVALRDVLPRTDLNRLAHQSVSLADATIDARELRH